MNTQFELNRELLDTAEKGDLERVEDLLKLGADPLGAFSEHTPDEHILGELFCYASDNSDLAEKMPQLVQLFYEYGMDIEKRNIPVDDGNNINPLWDLAFCQDENGLKTLKTLLDHGLDCTSVESLVEHILIDMELCDGCEIQDDWWLERTVCALKMIMLVASYPYVIEGSSYIQSCVETEKNRPEDLIAFRDWNVFDYHIDISTCTNIPYGLQNATVKIQDKKTGKIVWTLMI
jgi:hypothetical protein